MQKKLITTDLTGRITKNGMFLGRVTKRQQNMERKKKKTWQTPQIIIWEGNVDSGHFLTTNPTKEGYVFFAPTGTYIPAYQLGSSQVCPIPAVEEGFKGTQPICSLAS